MTHRIVVWGIGNVGTLALRGVLTDPALDLVGVHVSSDAKVGIDANELAGLPGKSGVVATTGLQSVVDLRPDCVVYTAMTDNRLVEALEDLRVILAAGINVVSCAPVFLQFPWGVIPDELITPLQTAATTGGSSLYVSGIDPGFANDLIPFAMMSTCERIDQVRCMEIVDYSTYDNRSVIVDIMGFGCSLDDTPMLLQPGVLSLAWGSVVRQLASGLGVTLDDVTEVYERLPAPETFDVATGTIEMGTAAALRFEVRGMVDGQAVAVLEHVTRLRGDLAPDWPQPAREGGSYAVRIVGEPHYDVDIAMYSDRGDHNHASLVGTAMRIVNAVGDVIAAEPGIRTTGELPINPGRGRHVAQE